MSQITAMIGRRAASEEGRIFSVACGAHVLHDGYTDLLYVLLPLWQAEFGLGYAEIGLLRALYVGAMAGFQLPSGMLAERIGGPLVLGIGTALVGAAYLVAGASAGFAMLTAALVMGGIGASVQHPIAADLVARALRGLPLAVGAAPAPREDAPDTPDVVPSSRGFPLLLAIGVIDSATRMGFLTFLPFLLKLKGADLPMIGVALTLIFAGGAAGKLVCGLIGARLGVIATVCLTEGLTAAGIVLLLPLPLVGTLAVLPLIGIALNGTSSVLYGSVPELVAPERRQRAFSLFYTGTVGGGALAPILYGAASDFAGIKTMIVLVAAIVLTTLPLAWKLRPALRHVP
jgi:FSR family fosmidomycin resistance protein-like MFS transporter